MNIGMNRGSIFVGAVAALVLWLSGLNTAIGAEQGAEKMEILQVEGYALSTPMYTVADIDRSIAYYTGALGLSVANVMKGEDGNTFHAEFQVSADGRPLTILMIGLESAEAGPHGVSPNTGGYKPSFNAYLYVADVDGFIAQAAEAGAEVVEEPTDQFWGDRTAYLRDPDGYLWMIASKIKVAE